MRNIKKLSLISGILFIYILLIGGCSMRYLSFRVVAFKSDALHFDYEDEPSEWFSGTKVELLKSQYSESEFWIYHEVIPDKDSLWREKGAIINCHYSDILFDTLIEREHLFSGVLELVNE